MASYLGPSPLSLSLPAAILDKFRTLVGFCVAVAKGLGKGRVEGVYQDALCMELQTARIPHTKEETIPILYKGVSVGHERLDIGLRDWLAMILELKAVTKGIDASHLWQVHSYMEYKRCDYGAVINFSQSMGDAGVEIAFVVKVAGVSYVYQLETGLAIPMKGSGYETPLQEGKLVSDAKAAYDRGRKDRAAEVDKALAAAAKEHLAEQPYFVVAPVDDATIGEAAISAAAISEPVPGISAKAVPTADEGRVKAERARLQGLWVQHKIKPGQPISKLLATLRKGLTEAGVAY